MSDSFRPHGLYVHGILQARILQWIALPFSRESSQPGTKSRSPALQAASLPAEPPGKPKNTGLGSPSLLQGVFLTQELNQGLPHCRQLLYQLSHQGSPWCEGKQQFRWWLISYRKTEATERHGGSLNTSVRSQPEKPTRRVILTCYCLVAQYLTLRPCELQHARLPCPSLSPGICSNSCPLPRGCHATISSSVAPFFSCLQYLKSQRTHLNEYGETLK